MLCLPCVFLPGAGGMLIDVTVYPKTKHAPITYNYPAKKAVSVDPRNLGSKQRRDFRLYASELIQPAGTMEHQATSVTPDSNAPPCARSGRLPRLSQCPCLPAGV
jgi:hypothetical protein